MKRKIWCLILALSLLLCACQANPAPDVDAPTPGVTDDDSQSSLESLPPSAAPTESPSEQVSSQVEAGEPEFTQTESFPMPFDGEQRVNGNGEIVFTTSEALYDYDTMWLLLEENFPYLDRIEAEMGIDWRAVRDRYRETMERQARIGDGWLTQAKFIGIISRCLNEFHSVGHLLLVSNTWRSWSDRFQASKDPLTHTLGELMRNPRSVQFYEAWEEMKGWRTSTLSANTVAADDELASSGITFEMVDDIPYVKMPTFGVWSDSIYEALREFFSENKDAEHLIIDIQGNTGGSTNVWSDGIVSSLAGKPMSYNVFLSAKAGSLNLALNPEFSDSMGTLYDDDSWRKDFPYIKPEYIEGMDLLFKITDRVNPSSTSINFQGKIWVLIDNMCYSAADQFAVFCKATGFATLVGTETSGNGIGSSPYMMALPYSGLVVEYESYLSFNPDGSCNGIRGTQPDLIPEEGQSALDACLAAIHGEETN